MRSKLAAVLVIALCVGGCSSRAQEERVLAEVNGRKLTYEYLMDQFPEEYRQSLSEEDLARAVDAWIETELLYQEALRHNIDKNQHIINYIDQTKRTIIARRYIDLGFRDRLTVTDEEIDSVYQQEKARFSSQEELLNLSHIVLRSQGAADAVMRRLRAGSDFAQMVADYSEDTASARRGGDIGYIPTSALEEEMAQALSRLQPGQFSEPIKSRSGYFHIFLLKDRRDAGTSIPLEQVKDDIVQAIMAQKQQAIYDSLVGALKGKAQIKKYSINDAQKKK